MLGLPGGLPSSKGGKGLSGFCWVRTRGWGWDGVPFLE